MEGGWLEVIIFQNNIKRMLKNKLNMFLMFVLPVALMAFVMSMNSGTGGASVVGIVDKDNTVITETLKENLKNTGRVKILEEKDIKEELIGNKIDYAIVIDKDFTKNIIDGEDVNIRSFSINETNAALPAKLYIEAYMSSVKNIAKVAGGKEESFYKGLEAYKVGSFKLEYKNIDNEEGNKANSLQSIGFLVMGVFSFATVSSNLMIRDKDKNIASRLFTTPLTIKQYMLQNVLSGLFISMIQIVVLLLLLTKGFKADIGPSPINMFIILAIFSLVSVAVNILIGSLSKNSRQANGIGGLIFIPFCMLGGCYWPREIMPEVLQNIANFLPTTWALKGAEKVIQGKTLMQTNVEIGILILFAIVFFLLSSWKKEDIAK